MRTWLERYASGERVQVWTEMTGAGSSLRGSDRWEDAVAVARETMTRARSNVERLVSALRREQYEFAFPDRVVVAPPPDVAGRLDRLEAVVGPIPLSIRAWFEVVGQVNLMGRHPSWTFDLTDALVIEGTVDFFLQEQAQWQEERGTEWDRGAFTIDLAPDHLHKADISGGAPYAMAVPDGAADAILLHERHATTFVNYLRIAFEWGGFPGWDRGSLDDWARPTKPAPALIGEIRDSLLRI
jgi:hypothetical protein